MSASEPANPELRIPEPESTSRLHPIWVTVLVTVVVTALSYKVPEDYAATAVGAAFIFAVWWLVLRRDTATIRHYGLALGGVLEPAPLDPRRAARDAGHALAWSLGLVALIVVPFVVGF